MKLIICDKCGAVVNNPNDLSNTATISGVNYDLCDRCSKDIYENMKFPHKDNEKQFIEKISHYGFYEIKKKKEIITDGNK